MRGNYGDVEGYTQTTKNVAALERAADLGLEKHPGQDVEYLVVDDEKEGRARVALLHEGPERYDAEFYRDQLCRVAESVLAPAGFRRAEIEKQLAERVDGAISVFGKSAECGCASFQRLVGGILRHNRSLSRREVRG